MGLKPHPLGHHAIVEMKDRSHPWDNTNPEQL